MKLKTSTFASSALLSASLALLGGCGAAPVQSTNDAPEREYTTGSNLPVRDKNRRAETVSKEAVEGAVRGQGNVTKTGTGG